jgi:hypothetical protein
LKMDSKSVCRGHEKEVVIPTVGRQPARRTAGGRTGEEEDGGRSRVWVRVGWNGRVEVGWSRRGILLFALLYFDTLQFALIYFDIYFLPRFTLSLDYLPLTGRAPHAMTKIPLIHV